MVPNTTGTNTPMDVPAPTAGKTRTGQAMGNGFFSLSCSTDASWGDEPAVPLSLTCSRVLQKPAPPSLLRPAKISTFITAFFFPIVVAIVFHLSLSQESFKILVELFISIFTVHL